MKILSTLTFVFITYILPPIISAFASSTASSIRNNGFNFRSAKKIDGASSHDSSKPSIPSSWKSPPQAKVSTTHRTKRSQATSSSETDNYDDEEADDDEDVEPGKMRVSEIKAELDLREVSYKDCFDKESLVLRLEEARATGVANPKILEKFNKQKLEEAFDPTKKVDVNDEDIAKVVANDGKLPGGLSPEMFKRLSGNPEVMSLLQSTKMQEAMKLMMTGGRDELENKVKGDPELQETLAKLDSILKEASS